MNWINSIQKSCSNVHPFINYYIGNILRIRTQIEQKYKLPFWQCSGSWLPQMNLEKTCIACWFAYDFALAAIIKNQKWIKKGRLAYTVFFGTKEPPFCSQLKIVVFLESESTAGQLLLFGKQSICSVCNALTSVWESDLFCKNCAGLLGIRHTPFLKGFCHLCLLHWHV